MFICITYRDLIYYLAYAKEEDIVRFNFLVKNALYTLLLKIIQVCVIISRNRSSYELHRT